MLTIVGVLIFAWIFLAYVVERMVEATVTIFPGLDKRTLFKSPLNLLIALFYSVVIAFGAKLDFFVMFGLAFAWTWVGPLVAALLMAGGSKVAHGILKWYFANKGIVNEPPAQPPAPG